jgi:Zn-dependent protease with chaperone function
VLSLPYDYWRGYASMPMMAPHLKEWWTGEAAGLLTRCAAAILFFWIPYGLMVRSPRRWWLYAGAAAVPLTFVALIALPVWVDPLTTAYHPLTDRKLYAEIEQLAARCGVDHIPVFVGGDDTTVVGLGPTNRIILDENWFPIRKPDQLRFTVGHELKHYVIGDNYASIAVIAGALLLGFFATQMFGRMLIARFHRRFGFDALSDPASLPLSILILTFSWLCILPFFNWYARHIEFEADRFGLELTRENHALAQAQANMIAGGDMPDWGPFFMIFRATHPTNGDRIRLANSYKPWEQGKPLVYGDVCKPPS